MQKLTTEPAPWQLGGRQDGGQSKAAIPYRQNHFTINLPIWAGGKIVGVVRDNVFVKRVRGSVHMLRKPPAWALDVQSLADAEQAGASEVVIIDIESDTVYRAPISLLRSDRAFELDRGFGRQVALPLHCWDVEDPSGGRQLVLWEGDE